MGLLDNYIAKVETKKHVADCNSIKEGWIKCTKPSGDVYGLIVTQLKARIDKGEIVVDSEDVDKGLITFHYAGSKSPF